METPKEKKPKAPKLEPKPKPKRSRTYVHSGEHITKDWQPTPKKPPVEKTKVTITVTFDAKTRSSLAFPGDVLDIFAEARDEIASGRARGKITNSSSKTKRTT